jgi:surfactin synthase thioesterase subunit
MPVEHASPDAWFTAQGTDADVEVQLFCLPHAGAGASTYRQWTTLLPCIEVIPVQLAGRESRFDEPLLTSASEIIEKLAPPLALRAQRPFALFGHSMGALLSYELAHALHALGNPPARLFVSGYAAPQLPRTTHSAPVHRMPDLGVIKHLTSLDGMAAEVLEHPEFLRMLLPVVKADFEVCETYEHPERPPLDVPITVLGGLDDIGADLAGLLAWERLTTSTFTVHQFPGGHFYLHDQLERVLRIVKSGVSDLAR